MAAKNVIIALLAMCSFAYGQSRALIVTTNGRINWDASITFGGPLQWVTNNDSAATTRSNLSLGLPALTNTSNAGLLSALGGLATNGDASALTNFPPSLLTTNGDGSGLTNLPNANLTNATGILPIANGGTGQTNAAAAIEALLPAYTNNEGGVLGLDTNLALIWTTNVGGGSGSVTNVDASGGSTGLTFSGGPITNGGTLTLGGTLNLISGGTGGTNASEARTALELGTAATNDATAFQPASTNLNTLASNNAINLTNFPAGLATYPSFSNNAGLVLAVATNETGVEWIAVSNTVTDASTLTNFPAIILQTNSADGSFPSFLARTNADASGFTNYPTFNQNTTGTASNVTGVVQITNGGTGTNSAAGARVNLLPAYAGNSNKVLAVNAGETDVEWVTPSGGGGITDLADTTNGVTNVLKVVSGGTGGTNTTNALTGLGIYTNKAVRIGKSASVSTSTNNTDVAVGDSAVANAGASVAVGSGSEGKGSFSVGLGASAKAQANYTIQLGTGTIGNFSFNQNAIQVYSWGLVQSNEWAALANAGSVGTNLLRSTTASGARSIIGLSLAALTNTTISNFQGAIFPATTTNAPSNTNAPTPDAWLDVTVGTNAYKLPLWQ